MKIAYKIIYQLYFTIILPPYTWYKLSYFSPAVGLNYHPLVGDCPH